MKCFALAFVTTSLLTLSHASAQQICDAVRQIVQTADKNFMDLRGRQSGRAHGLALPARMATGVGNHKESRARRTLSMSRLKQSVAITAVKRGHQELEEYRHSEMWQS
jgi:hypothetical protein